LTIVRLSLIRILGTDLKELFKLELSLNNICNDKETTFPIAVAFLGLIISKMNPDEDNSPFNVEEEITATMIFDTVIAKKKTLSIKELILHHPIRG
jgi:hypothetical protein